MKRNLADVRNMIATLDAQQQKLEQNLVPKKVISTRLRKILDIDIMDTKLSMRTKTICRSRDICTVRDLVSCKRSEFLSLRNCGKLTADDVEIFLKENKLHWGMKNLM